MVINTYDDEMTKKWKLGFLKNTVRKYYKMWLFVTLKFYKKFKKITYYSWDMHLPNTVKRFS